MSQPYTDVNSTLCLFATVKLFIYTSTCFEGVSEFKYLGSIIENNNRNGRCIKERIQTGNKAYYANLQMLKSKIISRRSILQIYKSLIRPVVTYWGRNMDTNSCGRACPEEVQKEGTKEDIWTSGG